MRAVVAVTHTSPLVHAVLVRQVVQPVINQEFQVVVTHALPAGMMVAMLIPAGTNSLSPRYRGIFFSFYWD